MAVTHHQAVGAYQRWAPPDFDSPADSGAGSATASDPETGGAQPQSTAQVRLPTADEVEAIYEQARQEGFHTGQTEGHRQGVVQGYREGLSQGKNDGLEQGKQEGLIQGRQEGENLGRQACEQEAAQLKALTVSLDEAIDDLDKDIAEQIAGLAVALAQQMVEQTLESRPESVVSIVRKALTSLPQQSVDIYLHPDDLELIQQYLGEQITQKHHHLITDDSISRGGCLLRTEQTEVDATLETRWQRILAGMGRASPQQDTPTPAGINDTDAAAPITPESLPPPAD